MQIKLYTTHHLNAFASIFTLPLHICVMHNNIQYKHTIFISYNVLFFIVIFFYSSAAALVDMPLSVCVCVVDVIIIIICVWSFIAVLVMEWDNIYIICVFVFTHSLNPTSNCRRKPCFALVLFFLSYFRMMAELLSLVAEPLNLAQRTQIFTLLSFLLPIFDTNYILLQHIYSIHTRRGIKTFTVNILSSTQS